MDDRDRQVDGEDTVFLRRALELAERGRYTVSPNPLVGCVVVRDGQIVGEGHHQRAGAPHAEAVALAAAGANARGATGYVTLEPCDHWGRTPPCTQALLDAGVARVVVAMTDPSPVSGQGLARLEAAGVDVQLGLLQADARAQNEVYLHGLTHARPFVVLKAAVSLDGRIAAADGSSQWLTGEQARARAHVLRAEADAVVVGSGTVLADDPALTVRLPGYDGPQPLRVVLDRRERVPRDRRIFDGAAPTLVWSGSLEQLSKELWSADVRSVLVEGGGAVLGSFLREARWDRLVVHVAPLLLGDRGGPLLVDGPASLAQASRLRTDAVERAGDDIILSLRPTGPGPTPQPTRAD